MKPPNFSPGTSAELKELISAFFAEYERRRQRRAEVDAQNAAGNIDLFILENYHSHYLKSYLWKKVIRRRVLKRDKRICFRCKGKAKEVHHRSYARKVLEGNDDSKLISLCRGCHSYVTFDGNRRRSEDEQEAALLAPYTQVEMPLEQREVKPSSADPYSEPFPLGPTKHWKTMTAAEQESYRRRMNEAFEEWKQTLSRNGCGG